MDANIERPALDTWYVASLARVRAKEYGTPFAWISGICLVGIWNLWTDGRFLAQRDIAEALASATLLTTLAWGIVRIQEEACACCGLGRHRDAAAVEARLTRYVRLLDLLEARGRLVEAIAEVKRRHGIRIHDPDREDAMLAAVLARASGPFSHDQIESLFRCVFEVSQEIASGRR